MTTSTSSPTPTPTSPVDDGGPAYPKDGSMFTTEKMVQTTYRWKRYKPDGARQMGKPGRWQMMVWRGDFFKWENCEEPEGVLLTARKSGGERV